MPVTHIEHLHRFALRAVVKPPIGQDPIHVQHHQLDACRTLLCGHDAFELRLGKHQITFADSRSGMLNAPTS